MNIPNLQLKSITYFNDRPSSSQSPLFSPTGQDLKHNKNDSLVFSITSHNFTGNKQQQINAIRNENMNQNFINTNHFKDISNSCSMSMPKQSMLLQSRGSELAKELNLLNSKLNALQDRVQHINSDRNCDKQNVFVYDGRKVIEIDHVDFKLSQEQIPQNTSFGINHSNVHFPVTFHKKKGNNFESPVPIANTIPIKNKSKENQKSSIIDKQPLQPRGNSKKSIKFLKSVKRQNSLTKYPTDNSRQSFERSSLQHINSLQNNSFQHSNHNSKYYVGKFKKSSKILNQTEVNIRHPNSVRDHSRQKANFNSNSSYEKSDFHNVNHNVYVNEFNNSQKLNLKEFNSLKKQMMRLQISAERSQRSKSKTEKDLCSSRKKLKQLKKETMIYEKNIEKLSKQLRKSQAIREKQKQIIFQQKNQILQLKQTIKKQNIAALKSIRA